MLEITTFKCDYKSTFHLSVLNYFCCLLLYMGASLVTQINGRESVYNLGDPGLILGPGRSLGEGHGYQLQYSCLENPMDRGFTLCELPD